MTTTSDARIIFLVCFFTTLSFFSVDLISPSLPSIMRDFNTSSDHIQFIVLIYALGGGLSQFIYGPLGDRFGRRTIIFSGAIICLIGNIIAAFAPSLLYLTIARFIGAFGASAGMLIARVVFRDQFSGAKLLKAFSYLSMSINISPAIAPVVGGLIQQWLGWRWAFAFLSVWALIVLTSLAYGLPETLPKAQRLPKLNLHIMLSTYITILRNRRFLYGSLLSGTGLGIGLSYLFMSPFIYQLALGISPAENGTIYVTNAIGFFIGAVIVNRLCMRIPALTLTFSGLLICLISNCALLAFGLFGILNIWVLMLPSAITSIGLGLVMPSSGSVTFSSINHSTSMASALMGGIRLLIVSVCLILVLLVPEETQVPMAILILTFTVISLFLYSRLAKTVRIEG